MTKPSDRAIAQAFYHFCDEHGGVDSAYLHDAPGLVRAIQANAREIDAAAPEGAQPRCPDCNAAVLFECVACSAGNYPKPEGAQGAVEGMGLSIAELIVRDVCESDPADPDDPNAVCIGVDHLLCIVEERIAEIVPPQPQDAARDREDAARLDFIERERVEVSPISGGGWDALRYGEHGKAETIASRWTLRAAIDAARAAGGGGE